jgi:diguanylate cyclase (GGDEF)-like protein/putative nucleotidyltransferase with HDIG domain
MLAASRTEATTDALTGLGNRRKLLADLDAAVRDARTGRGALLAIFDLDGFKSYNDTFGHPAGDALLTRLGRRLVDALPPGGAAYRMGGDEFCVLAPTGAGEASALVHAASLALAEHGEGFDVTSSFGAVLLPDEAQDGEEALALADRRMYGHKHGGRASAGRQSGNVLLRALAERHPDLGPHGDEVADLAEAVARRIGIPAADLEAVRLAAELHDVGKVAIPEAILRKPGALDDAEWAFMRRHTVIGERILLAAPALRHVATIVRSSHERFDGAGYPDGAAGEDIPLGARIIAVCDAYDAITGDRPYHGAEAPAAALAELRRCAGSQFDPLVVEAFVRVMEARGDINADLEELPRAA